jgi:CheY-like chemotaxis protein/nitrogen-specific signal transduction histidine kinase
MEASISRVGEGDRLLMTVMARDVTQLRQAERAQLAHAAAEAANRAKTEFLSRISHELRTPLNAVLGFAQLMRADVQDPLSPHHQEQIELVLQAGEHLRTLIEETLDVSRIEAGRMTMEVRDFELCELLNGALHMVEPQARAAGVRLEAAYTPNCTVLMHTDPDRLRQVMLNLLSNAIKYNRPGGCVRLELARDAHFVRIAVRDNGLGMSSGQKAQLFQPFNRLGRERSSVQGTGIGLVLVRQLVGLMGGELAIDSEPERGTVVEVILPASDDRPQAANAVVGEPGDGAGPSPKGVVLYVEDNPINAILVEQLLGRWPGTQLVIASDGATGLTQARALLPHVILLDMQLPDMDGLEVLHRLKADPATRELTVVALSANAVDADIQAALAAGAQDYWTKPIDFERFAQGMRQLLAGN